MAFAVQEGIPVEASFRALLPFLYSNSDWVTGATARRSWRVPLSCSKLLKFSPSTFFCASLSVSQPPTISFFSLHNFRLSSPRSSATAPVSPTFPYYSANRSRPNHFSLYSSWSAPLSTPFAKLPPLHLKQLSVNYHSQIETELDEP